MRILIYAAMLPAVVARLASLPESSLKAGGADTPLPEGHRHLQALENEGKGCWAFCGGTAGDCNYCGTGQCCRAVDFRNSVEGCELAENVKGGRCGAYKGSGFPALMNEGLPCIGACGKQPGDCAYCGVAGQCCRSFDGERGVTGCELVSRDSWSGPGSQCGQFKEAPTTTAGTTTTATTTTTAAACTLGDPCTCDDPSQDSFQICFSSSCTPGPCYGPETPTCGQPSSPAPGEGVRRLDVRACQPDPS